MQLLFPFFILIVLSVRFSCAKIDHQKESLLLYLDEIRDISYESINGNTSGDIKTLEEECSERRYDDSVYHRMVYFRACNATTQSFDDFCSKLLAYYHGNASLKAAIDAEGEEKKVFESGLRKNQRFYAWRACKNIYDYYQVKDSINKNNTGTFNYPNYTEWFIHSIPFALPVACGFTEKTYDKSPNPPSILSCLSHSYKWALYSTFVLDGVIILTITITNVIVLLVSWKTRMTSSTHG